MRRRLGLICVAALLLTGCGMMVSRSAFRDRDHVWDVCTDVVSSLMHLDEADKDAGIIRAHLASKWEKSTAVVTVTQVKANGFCDVVVSVQRSAFAPYTTSAGVKTYDRWRPTGPDPALQGKIVRQIRSAL